MGGVCVSGGYDEGQEGAFVSKPGEKSNVVNFCWGHTHNHRSHISTQIPWVQKRTVTKSTKLCVFISEQCQLELSRCVQTAPNPGYCPGFGGA